ncbi:MAG: threonine/serine exporter family protein [Bacteroidales bacterium]|nr:threonine/serine exporter family protein [Bacteroidales bacterium]
MLIHFLQDALFAAIAAIGFAAISRPPRRAYIYCALIAAVGHSVRFLLMDGQAMSMHIIPATLLASLIVGTMAVFLSPSAATPAETCLFPALLPMIPGIYAYRCFGGLVLCLLHNSQEAFDRYFYLFAYNGLTCIVILACMVIGATIPIFVFKKISFQATR